jgi:mono/diheme cytochrome c family protein
MPLLENQNNGMDVFLVACRICHAPRQALFRAGDATGCSQLYRIIALLVPSLRQS